MGKQAYREGSSEFGAVRPHRTNWNHCDEGGSWPEGKGRVSEGQVRVSSWQFDHTEPPGTTVTKGEAGLQGRFE